VLPAEDLADPECKRRLLREARGASALNHPNIVIVHEVGCEGGVDFIAMEFVEGKTLDAVIPFGGLPVAKVLDYR
jgi:serine/threonine protein kinase